MEVFSTAELNRDVQRLRREHPGAGVAVHMLAVGAEVYFAPADLEGADGG
jgi:hypothetical protein